MPKTINAENAEKAAEIIVDDWEHQKTQPRLSRISGLSAIIGQEYEQFIKDTLSVLFLARHELVEQGAEECDEDSVISHIDHLMKRIKGESIPQAERPEFPDGEFPNGGRYLGNG